MEVRGATEPDLDAMVETMFAEPGVEQIAFGADTCAGASVSSTNRRLEPVPVKASRSSYRRWFGCGTGTPLAGGEQCFVADDLVDQLLAQTGLHLGRSLQVPDQIEGAARIMVTALPGRAAVALDYEGLAADEESPRRHAEHSVLGRTSRGLALYTAHIHGGGAWGGPLLTELRETERGYFEAVEGSSPFPLAIRIEVPSARRLVYSWLFGAPGAKVELRNIGDVTLAD